MNFKLKQLGHGIALASLLAAAGTAYGATQGDLGATSTGSLDLEVVIPALVRVSNLSDVDFGSYDGEGDLSETQQICVYSNATDGYNLRAESVNVGGFALDSGSNTLSYSVTIGGVALTENSLVAMTGANTTSVNCGGGGDTAMVLTIAEPDLQAAPSGTYTDTLTLYVEAL